MTERAQNGMTCSQFEALLADALDFDVRPGSQVWSEEKLAALPRELRQAFAEHRQSCPDCGPLYAEAQEGMLLLNSLEELEPPRNLLHNILAVTSRVESKQAATAGRPSQAGWLERLRTQLVPSFAGLLRSRFAASFCMAFFSLSLTLSLTGVKISDVARMVSHPSELRRSVVLEYTQLEARVMRYYDNMRLVYQVEAFGRDLKKAAAPAETQDKGTAQPDQQNRIQPTPPSFKEVVQPKVQNAYNEEQSKRSPERLTVAQRAPGVPGLSKVVAYETAEFMRKIEGAQI